MQFYLDKDNYDEVVVVIKNAVFYTFNDDSEGCCPSLYRSDLEFVDWEPVLNREYLKCGEYSIPHWAAHQALELINDYLSGVDRAVNNYTFSFRK